MLVIGCYGCGNRGDDAILQGICSLFSEWQITAFNGALEDVSEYLPVRTVSCRMNEGISFSVMCSLIRQFFPLVREVYRTDIVVYGGGSLIHDLTPYNLLFQFFWAWLARIFRKRVYFFSIGVGPIRTKIGKRLCRYNLSKSDGVFVRDRRGFEICRELGIRDVKMTADAAFATDRQSGCRTDVLRDMKVENGEYICVTACQWFHSENFWKRDQMDFSGEKENLAQCIMKIYNEFHKPLLFVPTEAKDIILGRQLKERMPEVDFRLCPDSWNADRMAAIIENSYLLIGMRMHSIIMAARQGVPFVAIVYDEKVHQLLKMLHMEQYEIDLALVKPEKLLHLGKNIQAEYSVIQEKLKTKAETFMRQVEESAMSVEREIAGDIK